MGFGWLGGLMSLMPGYLDGQRQANKDNWDDLKNFNNVQAGQIKNAFDEVTFEPRVGMEELGFENGKLNLWDHSLRSAVDTAWLPSHLADANTHAQFAPELSFMKTYSELAQPIWMQQYYNAMMGGGMPWSLSGASAMGMPPSVLRR